MIVKDICFLKARLLERKCNIDVSQESVGRESTWEQESAHQRQDVAPQEEALMADSVNKQGRVTGTPSQGIS